jgi:hypothetical protein
MFTLPIFRRQDDRTAARHPKPHRRRPLVEALEGRQVLSTLTFTKIEMNVSAIVGQHIGMDAGIQGNHIGMSAGIQGNHIGMSAAGIQGNHISVTEIQGAHID